jgi:AdoMet-dependent heme synthase
VRRDPLELSTEEARGLFRQVAAFGGPRLPHVVISGGDPLRRPDLFDLIADGRALGLTFSVTPAATPLLDRATVRRLKAAGISSLALSLDGSTAARHDAMRGVSGSYRWTADAAGFAREEGLPLQINTLVCAQSLPDQADIHRVVTTLGIARWALFFLIATGRGRNLSEITPLQSERFLRWLVRVADESAFAVKTTEAHHFRRVTLRRARSASPAAGLGIRDANGIVFISHRGHVHPSGFLPLSAGSVRTQSLVDLYRDSPLFRSIRKTEGFKGKCGGCEFREACGGSRARAFAATGDPLESDPLCLYRPARAAMGANP